jgi:HEAT repeat protein
VRTSLTQIELDGEGWPAHTTVEETLAATLPDHKDAFTARVSLQAELIAAARRPDLAATFTAARASLRRYAPLAEAPDAVATSQELDRQLVAGADIGQLLGELRAARDEHDEAALLRRLRAMFALDPGAAAAAAAALRSGALSGSKARTLIAALTASGTSEAQKVVVDFLQSTTDPGLRLQALGSLGLTPSPTPETVRALAELADTGTDRGDRSTALLALGSTGRSAPEAVDRLMERLSAAQTSEERRLALRALGNSGDERALPAIREALASKDPVVRDAAVAALRAIDGPEADALIIAVLAGDPDPGVRGEAVFAASFRPVQVVLPALTSALKSDRDPTVRLRAVKALAPHRADTATVAALLDWVKANDSDEAVRQATQQPGGYAM